MFNFKILEQHGQKREAGEEMACVGNHRCDWKLSMGGIVRADFQAPDHEEQCLPP